MTDAARHYADLLAQHYSWMIGLPFEDKVAEQRALLEALGVSGVLGGTAIDLGCGPGYQAVALADLGFARVLAVDTSAALLAELEAQKGRRPIETVHGDMRRFADHVEPGSARAIVCMGDTLTHLETREDVSSLFADAFSVLAPGCVLVLTFRDLSQALTGLDRFITVRGDADRVMTCFLEYEPETVVVHDLIHVREANGWTLGKSSYRKLRLAPDRLADQLCAAGFGVATSRATGRLWTIMARKPPAA